MKIDILAKDFDLTNKLEEYIQEKVESFDKILGEEKEGEERRCDFRIGKNSESHKNGKIYFAEARVETPGKSYGAKANGETIYEAIDALKDDILTKIRRKKDRKDSLIRKGGRKIKELLKFGK